LDEFKKAKKGLLGITTSTNAALMAADSLGVNKAPMTVAADKQPATQRNDFVSCSFPFA
jgi:hypothetical protein